MALPFIWGDVLDLTKIVAQIGGGGLGAFLALKRYVNGGIARVEQKLDAHVEKTDTKLDKIDNRVGNVEIGVSRIKGVIWPDDAG